MNEEPLYLKIYNSIYNDIKSGKFSIGDKLPSEKEIAGLFHVSRITSTKALELLAEDNLIKRMPGKGSFVLNKEKSTKLKVNSPEIKKNSPSMIGFIISDFSESYGLNLIYSVEEEASNKGCIVIPKRTCGNQALEDESIEQLTDLGVNGLLIMPVHGEHYNPKILRLVLDGFPVVFVDRNLKGISAPFVGTNNVNAAKKATDYLLTAGHKHISFLSPPTEGTLPLEDRMDGFIKSHAEHGVVVDESIWLSDLTSTMPGHKDKVNLEKDIEQIEKLLKANPQITCFFSAEYNLACIAMEAVKRAGLRIPENISILCFDSPGTIVGNDFFTHIKQRERDIGMIAVQLLLEQIESVGDYKKIYLDSDLIIGNSTCSIGTL